MGFTGDKKILFCKGNRTVNRISLKNNYIKIYNEVATKGDVGIFGGSQEWFEGLEYQNFARQGCGAIAAIDVALYLTDSLNLRDSNTSNPKRSENAFSMYVSRPPVITQRFIADRRSSVPKGFQHSERTLQI